MGVLMVVVVDVSCHFRMGSCGWVGGGRECVLEDGIIELLASLQRRRKRKKGCAGLRRGDEEGAGCVRGCVCGREDAVWGVGGWLCVHVLVVCSPRGASLMRHTPAGGLASEDGFCAISLSWT